MTTILAIETSCDETAAAIYEGGRGIIAERIKSQTAHQQYGGVVPELAARDHLHALLPMVDDLLKATGATPTHIAYTAGPGLAGALLTGAAIANGLAFARGIPAIPVNHLEGHLLSPLLSNPDLPFPYTALLISGGHTQLWRAKAPRNYNLLGATMDDSAGEALDKTAILLGAGMSGADLEKMAKDGNPTRFTLPSPAQPNLQFSFSGIKTAARRLKEKHPNKEDKPDIAAAMQKAVAEGLATQTTKALQKTNDKQIAAVGGVAQNATIKTALKTAAQKQNATLTTPTLKHCTDNAAMIALTAAYIIKEATQKPKNPKTPPHPTKEYTFTINPRWQP